MKLSCNYYLCVCICFCYVFCIEKVLIDFVCIVDFKIFVIYKIKMFDNFVLYD